MSIGDQTSECRGELRISGGELANAVTHGVGLILCLLGAVVIFVASVNVPFGQAIACGVYTSTLIAVYAVSTLSHVVQQPDRKHALRALDQGVVYLLIAGTYTPLMWAYLPPHLCWVGLALVWTAAAVGKYFKVVVQQRVINFSAISYLLLGWLPALILFRFVPRACLAWIVLGGLSYTIGTVFLMRDRQRPYFHAIWHLHVMLGSACHFYAIYAYVVLDQ